MHYEIIMNRLKISLKNEIIELSLRMKLCIRLIDVQPNSHIDKNIYKKSDYLSENTKA